ncbi:MAG: DUF4347 domain-containing protein [Lentimicrobium sp.]|nr:DUF4347 domain-containing protein [Lentimicrobium sp.]
MKKQISLTLLMVLGIICLYAQNLNIDFVVIDNSYRAAESLKAEFKGQNTIVVEQIKAAATAQITEALNGRQINDLHIFVSTKPGALGFTNMTLNAETFQDYSSALSMLASNVTGKVVIHSTDVFTTEKGLEFKTKLEQVTGLPFVMQ